MNSWVLGGNEDGGDRWESFDFVYLEYRESIDLSLLIIRNFDIRILSLTSLSRGEPLIFIQYQFERTMN